MIFVNIELKISRNFIALQNFARNLLYFENANFWEMKDYFFPHAKMKIKNKKKFKF